MDNSSPPPSLRQIAEAVGVSRMMVSRAFSPEASIRPEMRVEILKKAGEMGYKPDHMVSELMSSFAARKSVTYRETVAVIWCPVFWKEVENMNSYSHQTYQGLEKGAQHHGLKLEHIQITAELNPKALNRILKARGIQSIIITPSSQADIPAPELDWQDYSAVHIGSSFKDPPLHRSQVSHFYSMMLALEQIHQKGYRRPVLMLDMDFETRTHRAYSAAFMAWETGGEKRIFRSKIENASEKIGGLKKMNPDMIIGNKSQWHAFQEAHCPGVGFASMSRLIDDGTIAGILQPVALIAESAVDLVMASRLRKETGIPEIPKTLLHNGKWVEGSSLRSS
ncbi:LacI family DNA-binding transcriptional regulator [Kiritimatiellaeota bacterium B1221]|nr:LacI family DNA-binding transcriptional regulator [Kiritimatiellaeota bacterium B1221]